MSYRFKQFFWSLGMLFGLIPGALLVGLAKGSPDVPVMWAFPLLWFMVLGVLYANRPTR